MPDPDTDTDTGTDMDPEPGPGPHVWHRNRLAKQTKKRSVAYTRLQHKQTTRQKKKKKLVIVDKSFALLCRILMPATRG